MVSIMIFSKADINADAMGNTSITENAICMMSRTCDLTRVWPPSRNVSSRMGYGGAIASRDAGVMGSMGPRDAHLYREVSMGRMYIVDMSMGCVPWTRPWDKCTPWTYSWGTCSPRAYPRGNMYPMDMSME